MSDPNTGGLEHDGVDAASAPPEEPGSDLAPDIDEQLQILDPADIPAPDDDAR